MRYFRFTVDGDPVSKQRPRFTVTGRTYTPKKTKDYEEHVWNSFRLQVDDECYFGQNVPVYIHIDAYYRIPKGTSKAIRDGMLKKEILPAKRNGDIDNVLKSICDGLNGGPIYDDSQIVGTSGRKFYSDEPKVVVYISGEPLARFFFEEDGK